MKIISGKYRGRGLRLALPTGIRPTTGRMKESLFSTLESLINLEECMIVDMYSGSGMLWAECLSRGAAKVISVDKSFQSINYQKKLKEELSCQDNVEIVKSDVIKFIRSYNQTKPDIIFCDPPYDKGLVQNTLKALQENFVFSGTIMVLEHSPVENILIDDSKILKEKNFGDSIVRFIEL